MVRILAGLMLAIFISAMDATIVATALPSITRQIGGFELYPWVVSGYLLTSTTSIPLWGKSADLVGRRRVLLAGLALFVVTSILCGFSRNMPQLIFFRLLQGIGAGSLQTVVMTIASDLVPTPQRARIQGFLSGMWVTAAIIAPVLGAALVSTVGWRWIFGVNVPVGVVAAVLILGYREVLPARTRLRIDPRGVALLTGGIALLLIGAGSASTSPEPNWFLLALSALALLGFVLVELRAHNPTVPLRLAVHPVIGPALFMGALSAALRTSVTTYVPLYIQSVLGGSAYEGGVALIPMSVAQALTSALGGWFLIRAGYSRLVRFGALMLVAGSLTLLLGSTHGAPWIFLAGGVMGLGVGMFNAPTLIVIQSWVGRRQKGSATALRQLTQTLGGAVGVALLGVLVQVQVARRASPAQSQAGLAQGIHLAFTVLLGLALLTLALTRLTRGRQAIGFPSGDEREAG
ncbi:MAG TPA: MFS transporter [Candidatus Nitrosotalea sp.]|nr:MFS transporter [Candidatus Nitrosotalea sp.]